MLEIVANKDCLEKALGIASLAIEDKSSTICGHTLFKVEGKKIKLYSTDKNKVAMASLDLEEASALDATSFTAEPKKLLTLIKKAAVESIRLTYDPDTKTLNAYASEKSTSYLSFPSFNPEDFLSFEDDLGKALEIKTLNAEIFLMGVKFITGFLPGDDKEKKFAKMFITEGVMYGSNGSYKIGAFESQEFKDLDNLIFPRACLSPITAFIERSKTNDLMIKTTSKLVMVYTPDGDNMVGFLKPSETTPKYPIDRNVPSVDSFKIDKALMLKKLGRLAITSEGALGVGITLENSSVEMKTVAERVSVEHMDCVRTMGTEKIQFIVEYSLIDQILGLYQAQEIDVYIDKSKCTFRNEADLEITDGKETIKKHFKAIGLISLAREK